MNRVARGIVGLVFNAEDGRDVYAISAATFDELVPIYRGRWKFERGYS